MRLLPLLALLAAASASAQPLSLAASAHAPEAADRTAPRLGDGPSTSIDLLALVQAVADVPLEEDAYDDVFSVPAARLGVRGEVGDFGYLLVADVTRDPSLLDARVDYRPLRDVRLSAGRFKTGFSAEALAPLAETDFIERSRIVRAVAPIRETGAAIEIGTQVTARAGVFNAPDETASTADDGDDGRLLLVGRLAGRTEPPRRSSAPRLGAGVNVAYTPSRGDVPLGPAFPATLRYGADARVQYGPVLVAAEALRSESEYDTAFDATAPRLTRQGFHATAGVDVHPDHRLLARIDYLEAAPSGTTGTRTHSTDLVLGYTVTFSRAVSAKLNALVPLDAYDELDVAIGIDTPLRSSRLSGLVQVAL